MGWVKNSSGFDIPTCRTIIHAILEQIHRPPYFHDMWYQFLQNVKFLQQKSELSSVQSSSKKWTFELNWTFPFSSVTSLVESINMKLIIGQKLMIDRMKIEMSPMRPIFPLEIFSIQCMNTECRYQPLQTIYVLLLFKGW